MIRFYFILLQFLKTFFFCWHKVKQNRVLNLLTPFKRFHSHGCLHQLIILLLLSFDFLCAFLSCDCSLIIVAISFCWLIQDAFSMSPNADAEAQWHIRKSGSLWGKFIEERKKNLKMSHTHWIWKQLERGNKEEKKMLTMPVWLKCYVESKETSNVDVINGRRPTN